MRFTRITSSMIYTGKRTTRVPSKIARVIACLIHHVATWWIKQAITRAILEGTRVVRLPVYIMEEVMRVKRVTRQLYQELGREPTPELIGERLGMTAERVSELLIWAEKTFSLDAPLSEEDESTLGDIIEDLHDRGPVEKTDQQLLREEIRK